MLPHRQHSTIDGITYKIAQNREERVAAFRLVYSAYRRTGLIEQNDFGMRLTPYHLLPTSDVFIALLEGTVISTVSLISDGALGLPMESIYPSEVCQLRSQGYSLAEVSCLADRRRHLTRTIPVFVNLNALLVQYARHHGIEKLLIAVHPRHERFYQRLLGFTRIGDEKSYPSVCDRPAVAACHDFIQLDKLRYSLYDRIYGYAYQKWELDRQPMSEADREFFHPASEFGRSQVPTASS